MGTLPTPEQHETADLVALGKELPDVPGFELEVVFLDLGAVAHLLEIDGVLLLFGFFGFLGLLVLVFAEIHDPANRGTCCGGHLHQVEPCLFGYFSRLVSGHHTELFAVLVHQPDLGAPDTLVYTNFLGSDSGVTPLSEWEP